jgi:FkbM family methyltransferase
MTEKLRTKTTFRYGFAPNNIQKFRRFLAAFFIMVFRLNANSNWATEVCQMLRPVSKVKFADRELIFKSGHGRLKWRADTFYTEEPMMIEWLKTFTDSDVFLDVGANIGTYAIPAAVKGARVLALELDPANIYCLNSNICLNAVQSEITIVPIAASDTVSLQDIYYRNFSIGDALQSVGREQILPTRRPAPYQIAQLSMPIDHIIAEFAFPQPNKIKIDVDGNEQIVVNGAWDTIRKAEEIYFEDNGLETDLEIIEKMRALGFEIVKETPAIVGSVKSDIARNLLLRRISNSAQ